MSARASPAPAAPRASSVSERVGGAQLDALAGSRGLGHWLEGLHHAGLTTALALSHNPDLQHVTTLADPRTIFNADVDSNSAEGRAARRIESIDDWARTRNPRPLPAANSDEFLGELVTLLRAAKANESRLEADLLTAASTDAASRVERRRPASGADEDIADDEARPDRAEPRIFRITPAVVTHLYETAKNSNREAITNDLRVLEEGLQAVYGGARQAPGRRLPPYDTTPWGYEKDGGAILPRDKHGKFAAPYSGFPTSGAPPARGRMLEEVFAVWDTLGLGWSFDYDHGPEPDRFRSLRRDATAYYGTIDGERRHTGAVKRRTDRMARRIVKKGNAPGISTYQVYALNKGVYDLVNDALTTLGGDGNLTEALDIVERTHGWDTVPADVTPSRAAKPPAAAPSAAPPGPKLAPKRPRAGSTSPAPQWSYQQFTAPPTAGPAVPYPYPTYAMPPLPPVPPPGGPPPPPRAPPPGSVAGQCKHRLHECPWANGQYGPNGCKFATHAP